VIFPEDRGVAAELIPAPRLFLLFGALSAATLPASLLPLAALVFGIEEEINDAK
jgi:hypothetical protein